MGTTATFKFRYPEPSHTPDVPRDMGYLANDVETLLKKFGVKAMAAGTVTIAVTAGVNSKGTVTFPAGRFTAYPLVFVTAVSSSPHVISEVSVVDRTTTGCSIWIRRSDGTDTQVQWLAVQV